MKKPLGLLLSMCFLIVAFSGFKNPPAKTAEHDISITNKTAYDIHHLYISPEHETHWGADELDHDHIVEHGHTVTVAVACGTWDVKIVDEKGKEHMFMHVELCKDEHFEFTFDDAHEHH